MPEENTANGNMKTAKMLARDQRAISVSEFFEKNRHLLGYDNKIKALLMIVKEAVDNALDATEEARILPDIYVKMEELEKEKYRIVIKDNGPGIVRKQIPKIFGTLLYGSKFHRLKQNRGQQGLGVSCGVLYSQLTTGQPVEVISSTGDGKSHRYKFKIDVKKNEPKILEENIIEGKDWHGVQISFICEGLYREHKQSVLEYIKQTAISNPYANIIFDSPTGRFEFKRGIEVLPEEPKEIKPHLYGIEIGILSRMLHDTKARTLSGFLTSEFTRVGKLSAKQIIEKAGILNDKGEPDIMISPRKVTEEQIVNIVKAIKETKLTRPPTDCLSPLGRKLVEEGLKKELNPEFVAAISRPPAVYRGWPFQIECITGDTKIILEDGRIIPVKEYVEKRMTDMKVYSMDKNLKILPTRVLAVQKIPKHHKIYRIKTRSGRKIQITGNNEIPVIRNGNIEWKRVDTVKKNEFVAVPREIRVEGKEPYILDLLDENFVRVQNQDLVISIGKILKRRFGTYKKASEVMNVNYSSFRGLFKKSVRRPSLKEFKKMAEFASLDWSKIKKKITRITIVDNKFRNPVPINIPLKFNEDLLYVLGLINSDGCMFRKQWGLFFVNKDMSLHKIFKEKINKLFGINPKNKEKESVFYNKAAFHVFEKTREILPTLSDKLISSWLKGYADGDGMISVEKNGRLKFIGFATAEREKAELVQFLLLRLGIISKIETKKIPKFFGFINGREIQTKKPKHDIIIYDTENMKKFADEISFRQTERMEKLEFCISNLNEIEYLPKSDVIPLGSLLNSARMENNFTQFDFPFSDQTIRSIEKNRQNITRDHLNIIAPKFVKGKSSKKINKLADSDILCDKICSIKEITSKDKYVYDLSLENGNFVANNIIIHNCALAYGGSITGPKFMRFANRVPLLYQAGDCAITKSITGMEWRRYGIQADKMPTDPVVIFVHMCSVWVPFTSESKEAIASYPVIIKEIKLALQECARKLSVYLSGVRRAQYQAERRSIFDRYAHETAVALGELTGEPAEKIEAKIKEIAEKNIKTIELSEQAAERLAKKETEEQKENGKEEEKPEEEKGKPKKKDEKKE